MPDMRIDELTELAEVPAEGDLYVLSSGGTTYKAQQKNLRRSIIGGVPSTGATLLGCLGAPNTTESATTIGANQLMYFANNFPNTVTITEVSINVSTLGAGTVRPAIYAMNADGSVGALLASNTTGFDVSTTGVKTITGLNWVIPAGNVFLCCHSTVSVSLATPRSNSPGHRPARLTTDLTSITRYFTKGSVSWSSWANPGVAYDSASASATVGSRNPFMFVWST